MLNEKDVEKFLVEKGVEFEIIKFEKSVVTSEEASRQVDGVVIKSILLICDGSPILCLLMGKDKVDLEKIKRWLNCKDVRLAKASEVKEITGYDIGALPPIAHKNKIRTIIDTKLENQDEIIYCGGGSHYHLLKIKIKELLKSIESFDVKDISM